VHICTVHSTRLQH